MVPLSLNTSHHENDEEEFQRLLYVPTGMLAALHAWQTPSQSNYQL